MHELVKTVYESLKESTEDIAEKKDKLWMVEEKIKSKDYTDKVKNERFIPERDSLKRELNNDIDKAMTKATAFVRDYQDKMRKADSLNPLEITEDVKLLNAGITLNANDIVAILERNKNNSTMTQIALRYAKEKNIDMGENSQIFTGHSQDIRDAENLVEIIKIYGRWIDKDNALQMLDKFIY